MRRLCLIIFLTALLFSSCQNRNNAKKELLVYPLENHVEFVKNLSDKILRAQRDGGYYKLSETEASLKMVTGLNETLQKSSYAKIKNIFGNYKGLELHSIEEIKKTQAYKIYRFKGDFELGSEVEIRSVLDSEGKLAGFFIIPWKDKL
ncbi:MAG: hypothetical protein ABJM36_11860 [Algibacter sp.]|uniref:hypothetical protein n=1 Tax=Algibacter sp. TaxID=1872428 RepID=UPI0032978D3B